MPIEIWTEASVFPANLLKLPLNDFPDPEEDSVIVSVFVVVISEEESEDVTEDVLAAADVLRYVPEKFMLS